MTEAEVELFAATVETDVGTIPLRLTAPTRAIRLAELARIVVPFDEALVDFGRRHSESKGESISCREGCASCCRQLVPLSAPEAFLLAERLASWPDAQRALVSRRAAEVAAAFERSWLAYAVRHRLAEDDRRSRELAIAYHRFGFECPFLEDERCSIYEDRPSVCRGYLVTTPASHCAVLGTAPVRRVPLAARVSDALAEVAAEVLGTPVEQVLLPTALAWAEAHAEQGRRTFASRLLLEHFVSRLA